MSYMNYRQPNAYTNGNDSTNSQLRRLDFETSDNSADERSSSRGPGSVGPQTYGDRAHGLRTGLDRGYARRRSRGAQEEWSVSRSRSRPGARYGAAGGQIEDILKYITQHWGFMATESCIPVKVALQLMDQSSLGLADQQDRFQEAHQQLEKALKVIVNEHHEAFNSSIGTFHKIQTAIQASQHRVRTLKGGLVEAKGSLSTNKPELKALAASSQGYDQMLQILGQIEQLQQIPENLEAQISEKRFLGAVETLQEALRLIRLPEIEVIGALGDLRVYLSNQEQSLTDILIEEMHSHLYLKSPYCEERWKIHMRRNDSSVLQTVDIEERAMLTFLENYDGTKEMQEDTTRNPETDTFYYIQLLVESLYRMGTLDAALGAIGERLPTEMFKVRDKALNEVEQRHPSTMRNAPRTSNRQSSLTVTDSVDSERQTTLEDLLVTLYAKFEAIAEGHRVLHDVTGAVLKRDASREGSVLNRSFRELWSLLQNEMRSLLHDHVATSDNVGGRYKRQDDASANIFRQQPRDRNKKLFKLADTLNDDKSTDLVTERDDLDFIFRSSVPGLVNASTSRAAAKSNGDANLDRSGTGHKLLVEPSVFNMGILLPPSLAFLNNLKQVVPPYSSVVPSTLTNFLDDFLINVFYPQLDETLLDLCGRSFGDLDAFQVDPNWQNFAQMPIFRGTARFFDLIEAFCRMLDVLPHDQSFSQLIITQMRTYYDRCYQWSKALLTRVQMTHQDNDGPKMRLAAELATRGALNDVVTELMKGQSESGIDATALANQEAQILLTMVKRRQLEEADMINDRKALAALCTLQVSMKWLAARCSQLRYISPHAVDTEDISTDQTRRWTAQLDHATANASAPRRPYLPLDVQTAQEFDAVITSFSELSQLVLSTLHIDVRLQLLHGLYKAMDTTYALGQPYNDPDPAILTLSSALSSYDTQISSHLLPQQYRFLTSNLHILVNSCLTSLVGSIPAMDDYGSARMQLNVLVLQQSLKNVQLDADLSRAARFYEIAEQGPQAVVEIGPNEGFAQEDLKALVRLCWKEERDSGIGSVDALIGRL